MYFDQYSQPGNLNEPGIIVPQQVYKTSGQAEFVPLPAIRFLVQGRAGLSLEDALNRSNAGLADGNRIPLLSHRGVRFTLRILVRGPDVFVLREAEMRVVARLRGMEPRQRYQYIR